MRQRGALHGWYAQPPQHTRVTFAMLLRVCARTAGPAMLLWCHPACVHVRYSSVLIKGRTAEDTG